jgi:hypothetical protein
MPPDQKVISAIINVTVVIVTLLSTFRKGIKGKERNRKHEKITSIIPNRIFQFFDSI